MKIAILGAGFAGLSAAYHLTKKGYQVALFEKDNVPGGLAIGYKEKGWEWSLEKHYHHFFTNDYELINLAKELGLSSSLIYPKSLTSLYFNGQIYPFNTPVDILNFSPLSFLSRLRLGFATVVLKLLPESFGLKLEKYTAFSFARTVFGNNVFNLVWQPLLQSKFGVYASKVNAGWLWARISKRTLHLGYIRGGFQTLAEKLAEKIEENGGKIFYNTAVTRSHLGSPAKVRPFTKFDAVISTLPTPVYTKIFSKLPRDFVNKLNSIPHLHALNLVIETKEPFLKNTYWLNINEKGFPFLCVVQHTNFIDKKNYGGNHLLYISNYLPFDHPYFKKTPEELFKIYQPYLKKINPSFLKSYILSLKSFTGPYAQPVFLQGYSKTRPFGEILPNLFFANLDSVYPWDRGTNYALGLGRKIAELIQKSK